MPYERIRGYDIYYEDHGGGEVIVLLHHGFGCTRMWKGIYPGLVAAGYRVILYDRRGYGRSQRGEDYWDFYVSERFRPAQVGELLGLKEALGLESFHLVGQCEGGVLAVDYTLDYPEHVRTLAISSTQCFSTRTMVEFNREKFPKTFAELDPSMRGKFIEWHGPEYAEPHFNLFRVRGGAYGVGVFDLRPLLPSIGHPALVLYPDRSFLFDVEQGVAFYRHLPRGELSVLPKCGHNTYEQRPSEYVREILDFLGRQKGRDREREEGLLKATCVND